MGAAGIINSKAEDIHSGLNRLLVKPLDKQMEGKKYYGALRFRPGLKQHKRRSL
jgi:hypothetical protein